MTAQELKISKLEKDLRAERLETLKLRMRMAVLIQHPKGAAAEKIAEMSRADFSESIIHFN